MSNEDLKKELLEIATILDKFPSSLQPQVFDMLTSHLEKPKTITRPSGQERRTDTEAQDKAPAAAGKSAKAKRRGGTKETIGILKDLNLRGTSDVKSFADFQAEKKPESNIEFTTVAVYYLAKLLGLTGITLAHINTCYKNVERKPPKNFRQNLWDTSSNKYGYIDASDMNNITIPHRGESFVEHDLPRKDTKSK